ncbi:MAG: hypothetical protein KDI79_31685 [Anaerolineae bacterium]|nr:hypothetical protein [Anaerolineae bacterium]
MRTIAHITNPVAVGPESDLFIAQPITFETMRLAQAAAKGRVAVELYSAQFAADRPMVPPWLQITPDLERSVLDVAPIKIHRPLPLIKDILDRLVAATQADYLIYTNVDIAVMPQFYVAVDGLLSSGYDAVVINRRTVTAAYTRLEEIALMMAQIGEPHPGYDCFVFKRAAYPHFSLGTTCIGADHIGKVMLVNLFQQAACFKIFTDLHLTFHLGDAQVAKRAIYNELHAHNAAQLRQILSRNGWLDRPVPHPEIERVVQGVKAKNWGQRLRLQYWRVRQLVSNHTHVWAVLTAGIIFVMGWRLGRRRTSTD